MVRIAINGFGRIGRAVFKLALEKGVKVVAINDLTGVENLAYLLKYDTVYGRYGRRVSTRSKRLVVDGRSYPVYSEKDPEKLPWKKMKAGIVVECTGFFTDRAGASKHLKAGARRVLISAPAKNPDITVVKGVNDSRLKNQKIVSNASCTTNCFAPIVKVLDEAFGVDRGLMTTIHAYTSNQRILDGPSKKWRRGRAAAMSVVPTTTGAAKATCEVLPKMKGRLDAMAMRVPVADGSVVDFTVNLKKSVTAEQVNTAFRKASKGKMKGVMEYTEEELVSADIIGNPHSCVIDGLSTTASGKMAKILGWYDNEYGYSNRMIDIVKKMARNL